MYNAMKKIILNGKYNKDSTIKKLDMFLAMDKITIEEYTELVDLMEN